MRSKVADRIMAKMPEETKIFVDKYADIVVRVNQLLKEKGLNQKKLAGMLEKKPSEIHKWLSSEHNFTLRSIAKLEAELGETILYVPARKTTTAYIQGQSKTFHMTVIKNNFVKVEKKEFEWKTKISVSNAV
jgi:ribosome-binding protein aMBF1 (putative translation factor)